MQVFLFFALFISVLAVVFAVQNNNSTTVTFAAWDFEGSLALFLLVALAAGALISFLFSMPSNIKSRWTIRQQRKKLNEYETSQADLRSQLELAQKRTTEQNAAPPSIVTAPAPEFVTPPTPEIAEMRPIDEVKEIE
jgi:uncharacterized integral membrane protein